MRIKTKNRLLLDTDFEYLMLNYPTAMPLAYKFGTGLNKKSPSNYVAGAVCRAYLRQAKRVAAAYSPGMNQYHRRWQA